MKQTTENKTFLIKFEAMKSFVLFFFLAVDLGWASFINDVRTAEPLRPGTLGAERCMPELGCFKMTEDFFDPQYRPINLLPEDRSVIATEFQLYTRDFPKEYEVVRHDDLDSMRGIDVSRPTMFIVHGFIDSRFFGPWMENLKDSVLLSNDYNVIVVDWSRGNEIPYMRATANTRVVGAELALLIQSLEENIDLDPLKVHIVGHSLGSHIAGYAGQRLKKLGRITGLDPAGPYFQHMPPSIRLDPTDAQFVDVIHTDGVAYVFMALGMMQAVGHVDFYPNNGQRQPGCDNEAARSIFLEGLMDASRRYVCCSHLRAPDYFMYSLNFRRIQPIGVECDSWQDYLDGKCSDCGEGKCAVMGIDADSFKPYKNDSRSVKMYLTTTTQAPFWESIYHITIQLKEPSKQIGAKHGSFNLFINGVQSWYNFTTPAVNSIDGKTFTYLVHQPRPLGEVKDVIFTWNNNNYNRLSVPNIALQHLTIKPMTTIQEQKQKELTRRFCSVDNQLINANNGRKLIPCS